MLFAARCGPSVTSFLRDGDFERLLAVLDPEFVFRSDGGAARPDRVSVVRGAAAVATRALSFRRLAETATRALVNGIPGGVTWAPDGRPFAVVSVTVAGGRVVSAGGGRTPSGSAA